MTCAPETEGLIYEGAKASSVWHMSARRFSEEELEEIEKIKHLLEPGEQVLVVARQSRWWPGGSLTTPNTVFVTDRKVIIRNPMLLGLRENITIVPYDKITAIELERGFFTSEVRITAPGLFPIGLAETALGAGIRVEGGAAVIQAIPKEKAEEIVRVVRERMAALRAAPPAPAAPAPSPLDELKKLKELLDMGAITEEEYEEAKKRILAKL